MVVPKQKNAAENLSFKLITVHTISILQDYLTFRCMVLLFINSIVLVFEVDFPFGQLGTANPSYVTVNEAHGT